VGEACLPRDKKKVPGAKAPRTLKKGGRAFQGARQLGLGHFSVAVFDAVKP
jgi:hypothetical protein